MSATDDQPPSGVTEDPATGHARLAAIVESSRDAIVATDVEGRVTAWNPAAERLYGYTASELLGRSLKDAIVVEEGYAEFEANLGRVITGEELPPWEAMRRTKSGERIPVIVSVSPIFDASGAVIGASSIARDISDELAARSERARLAAIVDSTSDAIVGTDIDGSIVSWNGAAERLYGYAAEEILGEHLRQLIPPEREEEAAGVRERILRGESIPAFDTLRLHRSGTRIPVSIAISPITDASGAVTGGSSVARDVSDRLAAERQRALTELVTEQSADGLIALDETGHVTLWNAAAERIFGVPASEAIGRLPYDVVKSDGRAEQRDIARAVLTDGQTVRYEAERTRSDGTPLVIHVSMTPLRGDAGTITGAIASIRDITEQRAAEQRMHEAAEREAQLHQELEQARRLESVGQLAGGVAHDFNNLLSVILNLAMLVSDSLPEGSQSREDVDEITATAHRAAALTRQLLIFSRRDVVEPQTLDATRVIEDLRPLLASAVPERIELDIHGTPEAWLITVDRGQLEQVIVNLVVNARDAIEKGGRIVLEVRNTIVDDAFAEAQAHLEPGTYVTVIVSDTGIGMPRDVAERAFEPFFSTKPFGQGTGLGLSTVYGIAQGVGGRVGLYSEEGHGTTIKVHFPTTDAPPDAGPAPSDGPTAASGECVALVEDHPDLRRITARLLRTAGYEVIVAEDAAEAVRLLSITPDIDALVTDVILPGKSGVELAAQLRGMRPDLRVLYTSGYSHSLLTTSALRAPHTRFVEKPFTAADLLQRLRELLDEQQRPADD